jgi:Cof subfamily protein (haloacid dehalogenase superfamily)
VSGFREETHGNNASGLLAVDVDGTLITDHGLITDRVRAALERIAAEGWEIVIATGRTFHAARRIIESLPFIRYALLGNGSCIVDVRTRDVLLHETIPPEDAAGVIGIVRSEGAVPVIYSSDIFDQRIYYDTVEGACEYFVWYVNHDPRSTLVDDILLHAHEAQQIGAIAPREAIFRIRDRLLEGPTTPVTLPFESPHFGGKDYEYWFLQVVSAGATKNAAIRMISGRLGIPAGRIVAVGDNLNDADMIAGADVGVAMGNAPDEIKRLAKVVVGTNNDSGLADVVEDILSGKYFT